MGASERGKPPNALRATGVEKDDYLLNNNRIILPLHKASNTKIYDFEINIRIALLGSPLLNVRKLSTQFKHLRGYIRSELLTLQTAAAV
jgi:hypothetical protein